MSNTGLFTTDGGAIPLRGVEVEGEVLGAHARVRVRQRYQSAESKPVEAIYTFPLPSEATLTAFSMSCHGRRLEGVVKEREQAFRDYDDALVAGHGAALLEQERPNVFTASVGNLLPGEETLIEIEYLERVQADEGALRWMIPTLVAPRYIPGAPSGDRTAHGHADPTDQVPDADRITPPSGEVAYGLKLDLRFELGRRVEIESPSHELVVTHDGERTRVTFARAEVALDRDVVIIARGLGDQPLAAVLAHRPAGEAGFFALSVLPDLGAEAVKAPRQEVLFVVDVSGSMEGASLDEARAALRLCLRHLREGDRFNVIAFNTGFRGFAARPVPFTQRTLEEADAWVSALAADGGTELLAPMLEAMQQAPDGVIVLLTDGQVGNEAQIRDAVLAARRSARIYCFGIGTNVSDALLRELARRTTGAVELIHPGERIDEKVVAQFARAIAPRVTEVTLQLSGLEAGELAPSDLPPLIDGEPWVVYGRLEAGGRGEAVITGKLDGKPYRMVVPLDLGESILRPAIAKLWATERIRELGAVELGGRRADRMRERIVELATRYGVSSPYTSFLVVETRTADRRASGQPETRVVPVNLPAGWAMFERQRQDSTGSHGLAGGGGPGLTRSGAVYAGAPPAPSSPSPIARAAQSVMGAVSRTMGAIGSLGGAGAGKGAPAASDSFESNGGAIPPPKPKAKKAAHASEAYTSPSPSPSPSGDPVVELLGRQLASGLWDEPSARPDDDARRVRATALALLSLSRAGITTAHALHGAQVKKAVAALIALARSVARTDAGAAELALGVAWLVASGHRTRKEIESAIAAAPPLATLRSRLGDEPAVRARVDELARG